MKNIVLLTLLTPSIGFASSDNLECILSSDQSLNDIVFSIDLDKSQREATITKKNGHSYKAKALLSMNSIQLKKTRTGPPGILTSEKYILDRNTLAITGIQNTPSQFPAHQLETVTPYFSGTCVLRKISPNRKI